MRLDAQKASSQSTSDTGRGDFRLQRESPATALFTDLYELTMAQAYHAEHMDQLAVFGQ